MMDSAQARREGEASLIVGLGNPGARYVGTRHNLGFEVVSSLAARRGLQLDTLECNALVAEQAELVLAAPQTYMNRSGFACRCLLQRRGIEVDHLLVVYDDVALPFGRLRLRRSGGPGGHRGMESIVRNLQSEGMPRLRLGVGPSEGEEESTDLVDFVLSPFSEAEAPEVPALIERATDACELWLQEGVDRAMNRFNG